MTDPIDAWPVALFGLALLGLAIGSFLNVVIWRVPRGESVVAPPSACPVCGARLRRRDNIPVLSWMLLRGRCRDCSARISPRYPLVELGTVLAFVGVGLAVPHPAAWPAFLYLAAISIALALIDLDTHRLPNRIVLPAYIVAPVLLVIATWGSGEAWSSLLRVLIGGVVLYAVYFLLMLVQPGGMGFGDVKLAGILGGYLAWVGWGAFLVGAFAAFLLGGVYAVVLLALRRAGRKTGIPFGPWMILGAWAGIVSGAELWDAYLGIMS